MTKTPKTMTPAEAIDAHMKALALTGAGLIRLCKEAGYSLDSSNLSKMLKGEKKPGLDTAKAFGAVFGVSPAVFMPELADLVAPPALGGQGGTVSAEPSDPTRGRVPLRDICPSNLNPRRTFDEDGEQELADSIVQQGLLQNLVVRKMEAAGRGLGFSKRVSDGAQLYVIVAGERRFRALNRLRDEQRLPAEIAELGVPVKIVDIDDGDHLALALLENLQRQDVNPMEEAEAFAKLQDLNPVKWSTGHIAERIGTSKRHVQLRLALVGKLTDPVKVALKDGEITLAQARVLATVPASQQKKLLAEAPNRTADDLKRRALSNMFPVELAAFPIEGCRLDITTDLETGLRYFTDRKLFIECQRKAAIEKVAELRKTHDWVDLLNYNVTSAYDDGGNGAIVMFVEWSGDLSVRTGLARKKGHEASAADERRTEMRNAVWAEQRETAAEWVGQLSRHLSFIDALMLFLAQTACENDWDGPLQRREGLPSEIAGADKLATCGRLLVKGRTEHVHWKDPSAWRPIISALDQVPDDSLQYAFAAAIGARLRTQSRDGGPHPMLIDLSKRYGIEVPPILRLDGNGIHQEADKRLRAKPAQLDIEDAIDAAADQGAAA